MNTILPVLTMAVTFAVYTAVQKQRLTAAKVFTSLTVFESIKSVMRLVFFILNQSVTAGVSLQRINQFLNTVSPISLAVTKANCCTERDG